MCSLLAAVDSTGRGLQPPRARRVRQRLAIPGYEPDPAPRGRRTVHEPRGLAPTCALEQGDRMKLPMLSAHQRSAFTVGWCASSQQMSRNRRRARSHSAARPAWHRASRIATPSVRRTGTSQSALEQCASATDRERCVDAREEDSSADLAGAERRARKGRLRPDVIVGSDAGRAHRPRLLCRRSTQSCLPVSKHACHNTHSSLFSHRRHGAACGPGHSGIRLRSPACSCCLAWSSATRRHRAAAPWSWHARLLFVRDRRTTAAPPLAGNARHESSAGTPSRRCSKAH